MSKPTPRITLLIWQHSKLLTLIFALSLPIVAHGAGRTRMLHVKGANELQKQNARGMTLTEDG